MRTFTISLFIVTLLSLQGLNSQDIATVKAKSDDISNNLDLELVATLFGEAESLEDFERSLNDPDIRISNLDLNEDDEVDYLRVIANSRNNAHLITIQAVLGFDLYQDVATIDVEKNSNGETQVQIVGDEYLYGSNYNIGVSYQYLPDIIDFLWNLIFRSWHSPYSYNNYPRHYHSCAPFPTNIYAENVIIQINTYNIYYYTTLRGSETCREMQYKFRRNDHEIEYPTKSFALRNEGVKNKQELKQKKSSTKNTSQKVNKLKISTGKKVLKEWKPASELEGKTSLVKNNKVSFFSGSTISKPKTQKTYNAISANRAKQSRSKSTSNKSTSSKSKNTYKLNNKSSSQSGSKKSIYKPSSTTSKNTYKSNNKRSSQSSSKKTNYKAQSSKKNNTYKSTSKSSNQSSSKKSTYKPANSKTKNTYKSNNNSSSQASKKSSPKTTSSKSKNTVKSNGKSSSQPSSKRF